MPVEIKFCGLTRPADAAAAAALGAAYAGFVFAAGPRRLTIEQALAVSEPLRGGSIRRVGVFGDGDADAIAHAVDALRLDVVQLHRAPSRDPAGHELLTSRLGAGVHIWQVVSVGDDGLTTDDLVAAASSGADGLLLDARVGGVSGGTGHAFDWAAARSIVDPYRGTTPIILAGGLRPENVARAIGIMAPDVVDVSSGVEAAPGLKDHARMRAFVDAVHGAEPA